MPADAVRRRDGWHARGPADPGVRLALNDERSALGARVVEKPQPVGLRSSPPPPDEAAVSVRGEPLAHRDLVAVFVEVADVDATTPVAAIDAVPDVARQEKRGL